MEKTKTAYLVWLNYIESLPKDPRLRTKQQKAKATRLYNALVKIQVIEGVTESQMIAFRRALWLDK